MVVADMLGNLRTTAGLALGGPVPRQILGEAIPLCNHLLADVLVLILVLVSSNDKEADKACRFAQ